MNEKIKQLSKGRAGKLLLEVLEDVKQKVADIRTPMITKGDQSEVRLAVIEAIDSFLVEPLKIQSGELEAPNPNEHI